MWTPVQTTSAYQTLSFASTPDSTNGGSGVYLSDQGCPTSRCKHAMCCSEDGHMYLFGGRAGSLPLKDLWRFDLRTNQWEEIKGKGCLHPPSLQEHTMNSYGGRLYVFGGEVGFSSNEETPLWIFDLNTLTWRKYSSNMRSLAPGATRASPSGRRGHTAVIFDGGLHVYGGYEDLKGSLSELWVFDLSKEQWHLVAGNGRLSSSSAAPAGRYSHTAIIEDSSMFVFGGMASLQEKNDLWEWNFVSKKWRKVKSNKGPGPIHNHSAINFRRSMFIFGGERKGQLLHELWRFVFSTNTWQKILTEGISPEPRSKHAAVTINSLKTYDRDGDDNTPTSSEDMKHEDSAANNIPQVPQLTNDYRHAATKLLQKSNSCTESSPTNIAKLTHSLYSKPFRRANRARKTNSLYTDPISSILEDKSDGNTMLLEEMMELPDVGFKRHTVHESMSYYSLCFPSPQLSFHSPSPVKTATAGISSSSNGVGGVRMRRERMLQLRTSNKSNGLSNTNDSSSPDTMSPSSPTRCQLNQEQQHQKQRYKSCDSKTTTQSDGEKKTKEEGAQEVGEQNRSSCPKKAMDVPSRTCNGEGKSSENTSTTPSNCSTTTVTPSKSEDRPFDFSLFEFEEDDVLNFRRRSVNFRLVCQQQHELQSDQPLSHSNPFPTAIVNRETAVIDFDQTEDETEDDASPIFSPSVDVRETTTGLMTTDSSFSPLNGLEEGESSTVLQSSILMSRENGEEDRRSRQVNNFSQAEHPKGTTSDYSLSNSIFTPTSVEGKSLPHSKSQYSSGYQSFTDDTIYDSTIATLSKDSSNHSRHFPPLPLHSNGNNNNSNAKPPSTISLSAGSATKNTGNNYSDLRHPGVILRRDRNRGQSRILSEVSSSSVSATSSSSLVNRVNRHSMLEYKGGWQPQVNSIQEVVIPRSPAIRRSWSSYSPAKSKAEHHQMSHSFSTHERMERHENVKNGGENGHERGKERDVGDEDDENNWRLCMYVFGGREEGSSFAHKQPIQVWKLYI